MGVAQANANATSRILVLMTAESDTSSTGPGKICDDWRMWPAVVDWTALVFGVEVEFVGDSPERVPLVGGWSLDLDERQRAQTGESSGAEVRSGKLTWASREEIRHAFGHLAAAGMSVNWSCGLHVHVGLQPWGEAILEPMLDAVLRTQDALLKLLRTPKHRMLFAPRLTTAMRDEWKARPRKNALRHDRRPQGARCGINVAAWYDYETVEFRQPNATFDVGAAYYAVELCLRWVAAVGAAADLPADPDALASALGVSHGSAPVPLPEPVWHHREELLNDLLIPVLQPMVEAEVPEARILFVRATREGILAKTDSGRRRNHRFWFHPTSGGFVLARVERVTNGR